MGSYNARKNACCKRKCLMLMGALVRAASLNLEAERELSGRKEARLSLER